MLLEQKETLFKSHRKTICYYHKDGPKTMRYLNVVLRARHRFMLSTKRNSHPLMSASALTDWITGQESSCRVFLFMHSCIQPFWITALIYKG